MRPVGDDLEQAAPLKHIRGQRQCAELPAPFAGAEGAKRTETLARRGARRRLLVTLYHGCHMQLAAANRQQGFKVMNFTDLLVRGLGDHRAPVAEQAERLQRVRVRRAAEAAPQQANGVDFEPEQLAAILPEVFSLAQFRGGLDAFAAPREQPVGSDDDGRRSGAGQPSAS